MSAVPREAHRVDDERAFVLHSYPYSETSLIVDVFTLRFGRLPLLARGARRPRSQLRGVLLAFQPLSVSWAGRGEVRTLHRAEWLGGLPRPGGRALWCGFYLNELLTRFLARDDPHEKLFAAYAAAVARICAEARLEPVLRWFEKRLLAELGYALILDGEGGSGRPLEDDALYGYDPDRGPLRMAAGARAPGLVSGRTLKALALEDFEDAQVLAEAKTLMRQVIGHRLEHQSLRVTQVFRELQDMGGQ
jgi:DNA repair protein RecO (recombination protein O)